MEDLIPKYIEALCREIEYLSAMKQEVISIHTIYFGGGTPSLLTVDQVEKILNTIEKSFALAQNPEITLEANPGTLSFSQLKGLINLGINRLSLGMQSANPEDLRLLGRIHTFGELAQSVEWARLAGFENLNLDLIYGFPEQLMKSWKTSLNFALNLKPEHLSLYGLTIESGTLLDNQITAGLIPLPDDDQAAEMYEWAAEKLEQSGYAQYEISNWARKVAKPLSCLHNLQYWRNLPYLGIGAGAHGYSGFIRTENENSPIDYIQRIGDGYGLRSDLAMYPNHQQSNLADCGVETRFTVTPATRKIRIIDREEEMGETMMMGLRLIEEGVPDSTFFRRFGSHLQEVYRQQIEKLIRLELLEWGSESQEVLRLSKKGRLLGNRVFMEFI